MITDECANAHNNIARRSLIVYACDYRETCEEREQLRCEYY